jgi:hypothetical protein
MHPAIAMLQTTAQALEVSRGLDQSTCSRIMGQLHRITDELVAVERRAGNQKADPVDFTEILRDALATGSYGVVDDHRAGKQIPEDVYVEGPGHDLRDLICSLVEYARSVGPDPVDLHAQVNYTSDQNRAVCMTELAVGTATVPDFLQRKLWETIRIRRGVISVISGPQGCSIRFSLPIERRLGTVLG